MGDCSVSNYADFLARKTAVVQSTGISQNCDLPDGLFPHQVDLVRWALRRGRAAIFADTWLGKSRMQLAWANAIHRAIGVELKASYYQQAARNLQSVSDQADIFGAAA